MARANLVGWFEVPVGDMGHAKKFYDKVFDVEIELHDFGGFSMGWFPWEEGKQGAAGSLVKHETYQPSDSKGVLIYFSCEDLSNELGKIEAAGGKILQPKTQISPEYGYMAIFLDTEGNRVALHSRE